METKGIPPNSFYEAVFLLPKFQNQRHYKKIKLQTSISHKHRCKNLQQNISKLNPTMYNRITYCDEMGFISVMKD